MSIVIHPGDFCSPEQPGVERVIWADGHSLLHERETQRWRADVWSATCHHVAPWRGGTPDAERIAQIESLFSRHLPVQARKLSDQMRAVL